MHRAADYTLLGEPGKTSPPALPIKQRRSKSSSNSIQDLEMNMEDVHLSAPQTPLTPFAEVFLSTDCNAIYCPIHRYEHHQARFFSDQTPPPIPKKTLKRTLSLPADALDPPSLAHSATYNHENPLYMITPFQDQLALQGDHKEEHREGLSLHQVTFDIPDEQFNRLLRSFGSYEQLSAGIQECYLQFLRNTLQNIEMGVFLNEQENKTVRTSQPNDFLLCEQQWNERDVYYLVCCPKVPRRLFAAQVQEDDSASDCPVPFLHPNIQQGVIHFPQCTASTHASQSESPETTTEPSHGGSTEACRQQTVISLLEKGVSVTILRDFPLGTLEDFVKEGHSLHCTYPEVYERRLCLLILQLVTGLQHQGNVVHRELKPQSFMLVWPSVTLKAVEPREYPGWMNKERVMNSDTCNLEITVSTDQPANGKMRGEMCQTMWEKWGTPRLVLSCNFEDEVFMEATSQEHQLGDLLRYCLHLTNSDSSLCRDCPYSAGLLWLVTQLTLEKPGIVMADVASVLQVLLWGPRKGLFQQNQLDSSLFSNWLLVKRSLLVLKLAEKGLFQDQRGLDWEDYLCLQYLCFTDIENVHRITAHMGLHNFVRSF
ncbi:inactive tyrosine-protein kinase PRAG1 [Triplophysa rosa]|nr:inactive tyrosine-protein kinase PRAG1 [Triplophysa rosa]